MDDTRIALRASTRKVLESLDAEEGRSMHHYNGLYAYRMLEEVASTGMISLIDDPIHGMRRVYITDKGRRVLAHLRDIDRCLEGRDWDSSRHQNR